MSFTLIAGFAVFGYVNNQAGVTEGQYGQAVGATVEYLEERFVVAQFAFSAAGTNPPALTIYLYNNGKVNLQLVQVEVYNSTGKRIDIVYSATGATDLLHSGCTASTSVESPVLGTASGALSLTQTSVGYLTFDMPTGGSCPTNPSWTSGDAYYAKITALYGNQVVYYQVD